MGEVTRQFVCFLCKGNFLFPLPDRCRARGVGGNVSSFQCCVEREVASTQGRIATCVSRAMYLCLDELEMKKEMKRIDGTPRLAGEARFR